MPALLIRPGDRASFKRCRRAWDLGSRNRRNYEPSGPPDPVDPQRALHDALAVYYYPGMWEWDRSVVQPLVHKGLERTLLAQRRRCEEQRAMSAAEQDAWQRAYAEGCELLDAYAAWAPSLDRFTPIRVEVDFEVNIPDPRTTDAELATEAGDPVRYADRIDLLAIDDHNAYWAVQHRIVTGEWATVGDLLLDERSIAWCWGWERFYLGMRLAGTVYNEIRSDAGRRAGLAPKPAGEQPMRHRRLYVQATQLPEQRVHTHGTEAFRRTWIPRTAPELDRAGADIGTEVVESLRPDIAGYPSPEPSVCAGCDYRSPCEAMNEGGDAADVLATSYRQRPPEVVEEGRLGGSTWSMGRGAAPPRWGRPGGAGTS